ncbi:TolC family protein [candidate division WOR-3 bacterium]|nr:TolC family protein [candidate division WOR-3 bacterium]
MILKTWLAAALLILLPLSAQAITYDQALDMAYRENPNLSVSDLGIDEAREQLAQTRAGFRPSVSFSGSYTRLSTVPMMNIEIQPGIEFEVQMGAADNYSAGFSVTVPIFLGGKRTWGLEMAELGIDATREEAMMSRAELHSQVTAAFYGLLLTERAEEITKSDLARAEDQLSETQARWKVGYASPLDLKADEVAVSQARAALLQAKNSTLKAGQFLNMVLGRPVSTPVKAEGNFTMAYDELGVDSLVRRALEKRPEIAALERAERMTELSVSLAQSSYSPSLVFVGSPSWSNPYQQQEGWGSTMAATVALEWPLYDGGKGLSDVRLARISEKKLAFARQQASDGIELEVRQAYASYAEAFEQILVGQTMQAQMTELVQMAYEQYQTGVISALDYQTILLNNTQVELAYLSSLYKLILARQELRASAWLWDEGTLEKFNESSSTYTKEEEQ